MQHPALTDHTIMQCGVRIWRQDVERGSFYSLGYGPFHRPAENAFVIIIHAEYKTAVDRHSEVTQPPYRLIVVVADILHLPLAMQIADAGRFKPHKQATKPAGHGLFQQ